MHRVYIGIAIAVIAILASVSLVLAQGPITVTLNAENNSGQSGTVTLTPKGNQTQVTIDVTPGPAGVAQPAHIHVGSCPDVGPIKYPLNSVVDGKSTTLLNVPLSGLQSGNLAVNVHLSTQEISTYVACGNIPAVPMPSTLPEAGGTSWPIVSAAVIIALILLGIGFELRRRTV